MANIRLIKHKARPKMALMRELGRMAAAWEW